MKPLFLLILLACAYSLHAQKMVNVHGKYFTCGQTFQEDMNRWTGIPFTKVKLESASDKNIIYNILADGEGIYHLHMPKGEYKGSYSVAGYKTSGFYQLVISDMGICNMRMYNLQKETDSTTVYTQKLHTISGEVFHLKSNKEWLPIEKAKITCILSDGSRQQATTDETGKYSFPNLPEGSYKLSVTSTGYKEKVFEFPLQENLLVNAALLPENIKPEGFLYDKDDNSPLAFAAVIYTDMTDTTRKYYGIADFEGHYRMENLPEGCYRGQASCLGYTPQIFTHNTLEANRLNFYVPKSSIALDEVTVKGDDVRYDIDRTVYSITRQKLAIALNSYDLFSGIPLLHVDKLNRGVSTLTGQPVLVLINGLSASQSEVLALNPAQVAKIEHYRMPPARYANDGFGAVVNIITKGSIQGGEAFVDGQQAINAGFGNYQVNVKYNHDLSSFKIDYSLNHRNYDKRKASDYLKYKLKDTLYEKNRAGINSPLFYNNHEGMLAYSHVKPEKHAFQIKVMPSYFTQRATNRQQIETTVQSIDSTIRKTGMGIQQVETQNFTPSADIYYSKKLSSDRELILNAVGTYHNAKSSASRDESETGFSEFTKLKNQKYNLIGEGVYSHRTDALKWTVGGKHQQYYFSQETESSLVEANYSMSSSNTYLYGELLGKIKNWEYNLSIGMSYTHFSETSSDKAYNFWTVRPRIGINRKIGKGVFSFDYTMAPVIPTLTQLGGGESMFATHIISMGNPNLEPYRTHSTNLTYQWENKGFQLMLTGNIEWADNLFASGFFQDENAIYNTYRNDFDYFSYGMFGGMMWDIFNDGLLQIMLEGGPYRVEIKAKDFKRQHRNDAQLDGQIALNFGFIGLSLNYKMKQYDINGQYLSCGEHGTDIMLFSKGENWTAALSWYYPFADWKTDGKTLAGFPVQYNFDTRIRDNKNMIVLNLSYRLPFGKKRTKEVERKMNNADKDAGILTY